MTTAPVPALPPTSAPETRPLRLSTIAHGARRLDAENYLAAGNDLDERLARAHVPTVPLSSLADVWQPSRLKGVTAAKEDGVPFLAATQAFDTEPVVRKWLSPERTPGLDRRYVEPGWIMVTCSGTVGDAIIAHRPQQGVVISHDLLRVVVRENEDRAYLYAFLRTRHARQRMRSSKYGNIVKHLEPEHLDDVRVPMDVLTGGVRATIDDYVRRCFELRDEATDLVRDAAAAFAKTVGDLPATQIETGFAVHAHEVFGAQRRLDGKSLSPASVAALSALEGSGRRLDRLHDVADVFGVKRFKHIYTDEGIPYIDSGELFVSNPELGKFIPPEAKADAADYFVNAGWILMASSGQLYGIIGNAVLATGWHENKVISNHVLRIVPKPKVRAGYLLTALTHPTLGRPLVLRSGFGSNVPEIDPVGLRAMPIVRMGKEEDSIADSVERAFTLRAEADALEDDAAALFESAIGYALGDENEDERDAVIARVRLREIDVHSDALFHGGRLQRRLARMER